MGAPRKYAWEDWFCRRRIVLVRGVDYHCSQSAMTGQVRCAATKHGLRHVRVVDAGDRVVIEVPRVDDEIPHTAEVTVAG